MARRFPSIDEVAERLRQINKFAASDAAGEVAVRLRVHADGAWNVDWGDEQSDKDLRGALGSGSVPGSGRRFQSDKVARELLKAVREHADQYP